MPTATAIVWLICRIASTVVVVPWIEELAFRGYLLRRLGDVDFESVPYGRLQLVPTVGSAIVFGAVHGSFVAGVVAGALYAIAQAQGRRLKDAVIAHATTNALIVVQAVSDWGLPTP